MQVIRNRHSGRITIKCDEKEAQFFLGMLGMIRASAVSEALRIDPWAMYQAVRDGSCSYIAEEGTHHLSRLSRVNRLILDVYQPQQ